MCDREDESMESEVEVNIPDNQLFEDLGEGDPVTPSNFDISNYLHIEEGKW